ncbi:MAG: lipopolysaccharide heptosyltransferase II [candidate division KSB1 bacterium]|nr:lipopolysaccharide heptosyltransferase II [candidate division KSB1 bacterium]MDZ7301900.1 lipopolysaccharide heptosyltransferase II [candidate division KSB1 bacterium]MDZ7310283.1 lipopolysaccharide heptosyltransferase II [candidate division KSB1 bacterium]
MTSNKKILIVQTAFIGDVILATPLAEAAQQVFPESRVDFMVIPDAANILEGNPFVHRVVIFDKRGRQRGLIALWKLASSLQRERYDLALVPHRSLRSALLVWLAGIPQRIGFDRSAGAWFFTQRVPYRQIHEVERNLDLLRALNGSINAPLPKIFWDEADERFVDQFCRIGKNKKWFCALAPGSVWATKRWPADRYIDLARRLTAEANAQIYLIGGGGDAELCARLADKIGDDCVNTAGKLTLRQSAALVDRCQILVTNDSAPTHLAVATRCKVITIFGPTVPAFGFAPFGHGHAVIEKDLSCRPCSSHGGHRCPIRTHACMLEISVEEVFTEVLTLLYAISHRSQNKTHEVMK